MHTESGVWFCFRWPPLMQYLKQPPSHTYIHLSVTKSDTVPDGDHFLERLWRHGEVWGSENRPLPVPVGKSVRFDHIWIIWSDVCKARLFLLLYTIVPKGATMPCGCYLVKGFEKLLKTLFSAENCWKKIRRFAARISEKIAEFFWLKIHRKSVFFLLKTPENYWKECFSAIFRTIF